MIYLVGSHRAACRWGANNDVEISPRNRELRVVNSFAGAQGMRPLLGDTIILLHDGDHATYRYLGYAQKLAHTRREISMRQAP